jgi:hypothetical protein
MSATNTPQGRDDEHDLVVLLRLAADLAVVVINARAVQRSWPGIAIAALRALTGNR